MTESKKLIERAVIEELGFPGRPTKLEGVVLDAVWILLLRARQQLAAFSQAESQRLAELVGHELQDDSNECRPLCPACRIEAEFHGK